MSCSNSFNEYFRLPGIKFVPYDFEPGRSPNTADCKLMDLPYVERVDWCEVRGDKEVCNIREIIASLNGRSHQCSFTSVHRFGEVRSPWHGGAFGEQGGTKYKVF